MEGGKTEIRIWRVRSCRKAVVLLVRLILALKLAGNELKGFSDVTPTPHTPSPLELLQRNPCHVRLCLFEAPTQHHETELFQLLFLRYLNREGTSL